MVTVEVITNGKAQLYLYTTICFTLPVSRHKTERAFWKFMFSHWSFLLQPYPLPFQTMAEVNEMFVPFLPVVLERCMQELVLFSTLTSKGISFPKSFFRQQQSRRTHNDYQQATNTVQRARLLQIILLKRNCLKIRSYS